MTAGYESPGHDGPEFDLEDDLRGALRAGLAPLHNLAETAGVGEEQVDRVVGAAWDAFTGFSARSIDDYNEVLDLAIRANGWSWAEAVLIDPRRRESLFHSTTLSARRYARKLYQRLDAEGEAAADDAVTHLSRLMLADRSSGFKVPAWSSTSVVRRNVTWRLNTAATQADSFRKTAKGTTLSLDAYWEALGESGISSVDYGLGTVSDRGVEAFVWQVAGAALAGRGTSMLAGKRAGAVRARLALTIDAAKWVLARGAENEQAGAGETVGRSAEEIRHQFAQDALLVCFLGLRGVAPATWHRYPADKVPTREVIDRVAKEATARGDDNAAWFSKLEARRVDVAKSDRLLHGIRRMVESLLEEAAHDDGN